MAPRAPSAGGRVAMGVGAVFLMAAGLPSGTAAPAAAGPGGLAASYPGHVGLGRDPAVLFAEDFESGSLEDLGKRRGECSTKAGEVMAFSDDRPASSVGKRPLQMTATLGRNTGGHLYTRLPRGVERAFARFYVKFSPETAYIHRFVLHYVTENAARQNRIAQPNPVKELGVWLKAHRQRHGLVARVFAGQIELGPAKYAEAEAGVVRWVGPEQERLICQVLALSPAERQEFLKLLAQSRAAKALEFADLYTRKQLEPVRLRCAGRKRLTEADRKAIVEAVFAPLA